MIDKIVFDEMLQRAVHEAYNLQELACDGTEIILLVTPEIAYRYFVGEMEGGRVQTVRAYGYEIRIYAP